MMVRSSMPSAPPSPACGLSPATASRGRGRANRRLRSLGDDPPGLDDHLFGERVGHVAERDVDRHRHRPELGPGEHHHRTGGEAGPGGRQRSEELGVAGMAEAGGVERLLADRIGDQSRGVAGADVADGARNRLDDGGGIRRIGSPRLGRDRGLERHDRQRRVEDRRGVARLDGFDRTIQPELPGAVGNEVRVGEEVEGRNAKPLVLTPDDKGEVGPDTAGFAHRQGQRR